VHRTANLIRIAVGWLLGAAALAWVFHDVDIARLPGQISAMNAWWLAPAVACDILSYLCQGVRWHFLLRPIGRLPVWRGTQAIYIGLFSNEIIPLRIGELIRTYLASRWMVQPLAALVPSLVVERLLDGVWLALGIVVTASFIPLPLKLLVSAGVLGAVVVGTAGLLVVFAVRTPSTSSDDEVAIRPRSWLWRQARALTGRWARELHNIGNVRILTAAGFFSLSLLVFQALAFWFVMRAYGLALPFAVGLAVFLIVHLGTAIPNAPANVGSFQFFTVLGLGLFGVEKTQATGFSIVVFLILTLPLWALGLLALSNTGMTLSSIRDDLRNLGRSDV
jgi:uncharacterized protein (TIRG00374 family)